MKTITIFERLQNGETILSNDPKAYKLIEASFDTKKILVEMNNASNPNVSGKQKRDYSNRIISLLKFD
ncbi:hypothetical protein [Flavobacterium polysaccharolyticum]|uniref:Uncharacterized protein n=1 Tax=Flavobacterium polysaccharolyticum TaxID=3133148 RepID=A0ABU9NSH0_9FLAO